MEYKKGDILKLMIDGGAYYFHILNITIGKRNIISMETQLYEISTKNMGGGSWSARANIGKFPKSVLDEWLVKYDGVLNG